MFSKRFRARTYFCLCTRRCTSHKTGSHVCAVTAERCKLTNTEHVWRLSTNMLKPASYNTSKLRLYTHPRRICSTTVVDAPGYQHGSRDRTRSGPLHNSSGQQRPQQLCAWVHSDATNKKSVRVGASVSAGVSTWASSGHVCGGGYTGYPMAHVAVCDGTARTLARLRT
jgi:hypothetical protein